MLKRLLLVIFILQSLASTAWAGMEMPQQTQMQIMHQAMLQDQDCCQQAKSHNVSCEQQNMADMACCQQGHCHNLLCQTAQINASVALIPEIISLTRPSISLISTTFSSSVPFSSIQPETPPPSA